MKYALLITAAVAVFAAPAWANPAALQLAQRNNCLACHAIDKKLVGPSWQDVARKYAGDANAEAKLIAKVKKGGVGVWGQVPMPPNATLKDSELKTIVHYLLGLK